MCEWKKVTLDKMGVVSRGKSKHRPRNDARLFGGKYPFIQTGDIGAAGLYVQNYSQTYNEEGLAQSKLWDKDTLCITIAANIADTALLAFPACFPDSVMGFVPYKNVSNVKFVKYCFDILKKDCQQISQGTAQDNLSWKKLSTILFPCPPIEVQNRIVEVLSRYDTLIENYQKQIKLLEEAAQRLYKEWFVDLRFPGYENTKMVDGLPEGWERKPLNEVFSYVRGKSYSTSELSDEGCLMVNLKNIQAFGGYKRGAEKRFIGTYKQEQTLKKGDLVMGVTDMTQERRLVGHVALIPDFNEPVTFSMDLIKIVPFNVPTSFLYCSMRYGEISKQISPLANGVNVLHLKPEAMMGIVMTVPKIELINKFCQFVEETINRILNNQSQIRLLTEARDRLLPKVMGGEIQIV